MATAKKSQYSRTKPKAGSAKNPISQVPPSMPPKEPSTDPNTPALREGISIEGEFVPFTVETYVSRLTEASEQNSPKTIFAKQIAENGGIAELAVQMAPSEGDAESQVLEATRRALLYREAEQYVLAELRESGDIKSGLLKCREAWERRKRHENPIAYTHKTDANGKPLPIALEEALRVLMPHDAKQRRLTYFQKWFADDCVRQLRAEIRACEKRADDENLNPREHTTAFAASLAKRLELEDLLKDSRKLLIKSVEEKIHEMTKHGVDPRLFDRARLTFRDWKAAEISKIRKASGIQGAKRKQKRVARPPAAAMKEILTPLLRKSKRDLT